MNIEIIAYLVVWLLLVVPWFGMTVSLVRLCWIVGDSQLAEARLAEERTAFLKRCDYDPYYFR